ncbi:MAG: hypothetical protein RLZZ297_490 [Chloroflexota bacterium]|jgi:serine/threonine-protein kinase
MTTRPDILCPSCRRINPRRATACRFCGHALAFVDGAVRYSLTRLIKTGGQAVIFEAVDDSSNRTYAIKEIMLPLDPERTAEAFQRCVIEARLLATLAHPGIPRFYSCIIDNGRVYIVMDYVRGTDLEDLLRQRGRFDEPTVLAIANQICDILHYLHSQANPVIFRDVKPSNIMYDGDGTVTMIDFGIARFTNSQRGNIMGTPGYAPPEQYRGDISPSADIYALGATMHHLLSGRDPRGHKPFTFAALRDIVPTISPSTAAIVATALQLAPADRFDSILTMRESIRTVLRGEQTIQFTVLGSTTPMPVVAPRPAALDLAAPVVASGQLFFADESDPTALATDPVDPNDTADIGAAYITAVISDPAENHIVTDDLDFTFAQHIQDAAVDVDPTAHRALTLEHRFSLDHSRPWHTLAFLAVVAVTLALLVWTEGGTNRTPWRPNTQTVTVVLDIEVAADTDLDAAFDAALRTHITQTYGPEWVMHTPAAFYGSPPEALGTTSDGDSRYRGRLTVTLDRAP